MNAIVALLQELVVLYVIGFIGFLAKRKKVLPLQTEQVLTQILFYITMPALILYSMTVATLPKGVSQFFILILLSGFILTLACLLAYFFRKKANLPKSRETVFESVIIFGNQGFIGYAVCFFLFQEEGIVYAAIFNIIYLLLIWTYGIYLFERGGTKINWRNVIWNPGLIATLTGTLFLFSPLELPPLIMNLLEDVGTPTIPLSMLLIGCLIGNLSFPNIWALCRERSIWQVTVTRLLLIPLCLVPFIYLNIPFTVIAVAILITGTPCAPTVSLYAQKYGGDVYFASICVCISTLTSIFSIPFLYALVKFIM